MVGEQEREETNKVASGQSWRKITRHEPRKSAAGGQETVELADVKGFMNDGWSGEEPEPGPQIRRSTWTAETQTEPRGRGDWSPGHGASVPLGILPVEQHPGAGGWAPPGPATFLPLSPSPLGKAGKEFVQLALSAETQCHFYLSHPALEMRQAAGWGTAVSPIHSQGANSRSQPRQWQKQSWQGVRSSSWLIRDRPLTSPPSA